MASQRNPDGSANYFARHPGAVQPPTRTHPVTSTKKNVKGPGPAQGFYQNQQQQLQDKGGA